MNKNLVVFLLLWWHGLLAEEYSIIRRVRLNSNEDDLIVLPDRFVLPTSICSAGNVSVKCSDMGGKLVRSRSCTCQCTKDKSTFAFHRGWNCIKNNIFHYLSGCSHRLDNSDTNSPIITITRNLDFPYLVLPKLNSSTCNIVADNGSSLTCDGTWEPLSSSLITNKFGVDKYEYDDEIDWYLYKKKSLDAGLSGQVIRLNIECKRPTVQGYCVIMKIKGQINCPLPPTPMPTITTTSSTTQARPRTPLFTIVTAAITTKKLTITMPSATQTSSRPSPSSTPTTTTAKPTTPHKRTSPEPVQTSNPTTWISILTELVSSRPDHKDGHQSTTEAKQSTPFRATTSFLVKNHKKSASKERDNSSLIAGAVAGIIGLVIIVMAIMVIVRKRKKRECDEHRTDTFDNAGYGRGQDNSLRFNGQQSPDEDEYSYAYNNAVPFVRANKKLALESHTSNDDELGPSVANRVYGQTEELNQTGPASYNEFEVPVYNILEEAVYAKVDKSKKENPPSFDSPIYNTLEEPEYAKVDKTRKTKVSENHNEPLYNVLEGPETDEGLSEEPPCYQVLEGPFSESAPVYDVLEGPESDETPVYGALDGQDPHVYGALDKVTAIQGSPAENRGYDDMVYDSVGDVINEQGDIYQELNQSGQRDSDVYQALNYPNKTMQLNELNQTHSIA